jgi:hypothetical protein
MSQFLSSGGWNYKIFVTRQQFFIWPYQRLLRILENSGQRKFQDIFPLTEMQELRVDTAPLFHQDELS